MTTLIGEIRLPHPLFVQSKQLSAVEQEEQEMLETKSIPLRNYLMRHVMPTLTQGLIQVCDVRPDDPVDFLVSGWQSHIDFN